MQAMTQWRKWLLTIGMVFLLASLAGCQSSPPKTPAGPPAQTAAESSAKPAPKPQPSNQAGAAQVQVTKGESYTSRDKVAAYIKKFQTLPPNYITKAEAEKLGWDNTKGNLWKVTQQKSIGGDRFGNREGLLPKASGRQYYECDIDYRGGYRGAKRIIYSNDGLIFYTDDHYKTFKPL